jgi:cobalt-zinc-cadmium resistance protein CzcA
MRRQKTSGARGAVLRRLTAYYESAVSFFVKRRGYAIALAVGLLLVGAAVFPRLGSEFTPRLQEGTMVLRLTMPPSVSLTKSTELTMIVERRLMKIPEISGVVTRIGRGEIGAHTDPVNSAEMYILLHPRNEWRNASTQPELEEQIRLDLGDIPGIATNFTQPIAMTVDELLEGVRAELAIKLFGDELDELIARGNEIKRVVETVPGAVDVQVDQVAGTPQLVITVDRQAVARYGMNVADVQKTIRAAVGGQVAGQVFEGIRRFDIYVRFAAPYRSTADSIGDILVDGPSGVRVPLSELAHIKEIVGPRQITREDNQRFITIQLNVVGRDIGSFVAEASEKLASAVTLPPGYLLTWGGQFRLQQEANQRLAVVVPITLLIVFFLLLLSFGSIANSLLIITNIPLALVGGVVALWATGQNLSVPSSVGFIALFGIALENGMVLVTRFNQLVKDGVAVNEASVRGATQRLRPVLITAATTALGLFPLLFSTGTGSEVQRPLATVVVGGLLTSTILTLLVIPALYRWFSEPST